MTPLASALLHTIYEFPLVRHTPLTGDDLVRGDVVIAVDSSAYRPRELYYNVLDVDGDYIQVEIDDGEQIISTPWMPARYLVITEVL